MRKGSKSNDCRGKICTAIPRLHKSRRVEKRFVFNCAPPFRRFRFILDVCSLPGAPAVGPYLAVSFYDACSFN